MSALTAPALPSRTKIRKSSEIDSREHTPTQSDPVRIPDLGDDLDHESPIIKVEVDLDKKSLDVAAFNEEPVTIMIHRSAEKFSPETTDFICNNNVKAEMLFKNGWIQMGYLPRGYEIVVKRKTVEAMANAKMDHITTRIEDAETERPRNFADRLTTATCSFTVIEDKNPRGGAWLSSLLRQR